MTGLMPTVAEFLLLLTSVYAATVTVYFALGWGIGWLNSRNPARRIQAHRRGEAELTYRELAARTGWSLGTVAGRPLT